MPPPSNDPALHLSILDGQYFVVQADKEEEKLEDWVMAALNRTISTKNKDLFAVARTDEEVSIVGKMQEGYPEACQRAATWRVIKIKGPMDFSLTGIMAGFTAPLKVQSVPLFAISTWNTDYILIDEKHFEIGVTALKNDGWIFEDSV